MKKKLTLVKKSSGLVSPRNLRKGLSTFLYQKREEKRSFFMLV